jgi:hypothetical protein
MSQTRLTYLLENVIIIIMMPKAKFNQCHKIITNGLCGTKRLAIIFLT